MTDDRRFVDEVLRVNQRYLTEVVEGFDFCPYARGAREAHQVERRVVLAADEDEARRGCVAAIEELEPAPGVVIGLLILPRLDVGPEAFDRFVNRVREDDQVARRTGAGRRAAPADPSVAAGFALAGFHPFAPYDTGTPDRLVMLLRRSPDPTIQLVRFSALAAVKGSQPSGKKFLFHFNAGALAELAKRAELRSPSEKIAQANFATVAREGEPRIRAVLDQIRADRDASYARFR